MELYKSYLHPLNPVTKYMKLHIPDWESVPIMECLWFYTATVVVETFGVVACSGVTLARRLSLFW